MYITQWQSIHKPEYPPARGAPAICGREDGRVFWDDVMTGRFGAALPGTAGGIEPSGSPPRAATAL